MSAVPRAFVRLAALVRLAERRREPAETPAEISARGWRELAWTALTRTLHHRAPTQAAAATFYAFLAFAPAVAAFGSLYGAVASPQVLHRQLAAFAGLAPKGVLDLVSGEMMRFARGRPDRLAVAALGFGAVSLVSATSAARAVVNGLNTAYHATEARPWWMRRLLGMAFAAGVGLIMAATAYVVLKSADMSDERVPWAAALRQLGRVVLLFAGLVAALSLLYRYGPDRPRARWRWVTPGSTLAAAAGLSSAAGTTFYLARFAAYERTYGGLGSIIGLLIWMWSVMLVVLAGAELNHAMEQKTSADTAVTGRPEG